MRIRGKMQLRPIGVVRSPVSERGLRDFSSVVSTIALREEFAEALDGIERFSHIVVLYWFHLSEEPTSLKVHPRGDPRNPLRGIFATCSPVRPNPLGMTTVRLLERQGNELRVQGLDAVDGTPVVDIKPYIRPDT
jgi:tRNA-Thr(GGU) m(6)t(6)A37 methyltransferase TsaA